ncbi:MAG: hypothetical protein EAZ08_07825 [Cytophagales bacterium]|nr:MAG: hypothetical protein EAZ08_07825 [Cytophagales bacterium]
MSQSFGKVGSFSLKVFKTISEVQQDLDKWWNSYNFERPHSATGIIALSS